MTLKIALLILSIALLVTIGNETIVLAQETGKKGNIYAGANGNAFRSENLISINQEDPMRYISNTLNILHKLFGVPNTLGYDTLKSTIALFVVIDPIGTVPLFIALTEKMGREERKGVSKTAVITSGVLLLVFAVGGTQIFSIFGVSIFSFMIAGGVLLFIVAIELLTHGIWRFGAPSGSLTAGESGVVPLAFPLLAGPGAITSVIISYETAGLVVTILSIAIVIGITYIILQFINPIYRILGRRGSVIITRVFAVFIAAIAIQYIEEGIRRFFI